MTLENYDQCVDWHFKRDIFVFTQVFFDIMEKLVPQNHTTGPESVCRNLEQSKNVTAESEHVGAYLIATNTWIWYHVRGNAHSKNPEIHPPTSASRLHVVWFPGPRSNPRSKDIWWRIWKCELGSWWGKMRSPRRGAVSLSAAHSAARV